MSPCSFALVLPVFKGCHKRILESNFILSVIQCCHMRILERDFSI